MKQEYKVIRVNRLDEPGTIVSKDGHKAIIQLETGATIETLSLLNVGETVRLHYDSINEDWVE